MIEVTSLCGLISLGKQGENLARVVYFDEPELWKNTFGEGVCQLVHKRSGDDAPYPVVLEIENNRVCWKITASDTAKVGEGKCELRYVVNDIVVKSKIWTTDVTPSLGEATAEPPEPEKAWVDQVLDAAEKVESATTHQPMIGENKNWFVWDANTLTYVDTGIVAEGVPGKDGKLKFIPVNELPTEDIDVSAIYMKAVDEPTSENTYEEFIYVDGKWESLGTASIDIDLTDYVKNTDYATTSKQGLVYLPNWSGIGSNSTGGINLKSLTKTEINNRDNYKALKATDLDYAVKVGLTTNTETLTEEEKASACKWLGAKGKLETINTITTTEDTKEITINTDSSGNAFDLDKILVTVDMTQANISKAMSVYTYLGNVGSKIFSSVSGYNSFIFSWDRDSGIAISERFIYANKEFRTKLVSFTDDTFIMDSFALRVYSEGEVLPTGTKITVKGVRK